MKLVYRDRLFSELATRYVWPLIVSLCFTVNINAAPQPPTASEQQTNPVTELNKIAKQADKKESSTPQTPAKSEQQTGPVTDIEKVAQQAVKPEYEHTLKGANKAFKNKHYQDALTILVKLEGDKAGTVEYDYLLGRAALATKQYDVAVAAFTRVLTVDPNFAGARFELARTYYSKGVMVLARGPFEQARTEFELVAKMNPPADLLAAIKQYQSNIDTYLAERETEFDIFVELMAGYDTNIGTTPKNDSFSYYDPNLPGYQTYDLKEKYREEEKESAVGHIRAGVGIAWPLFSNNFEIFGLAEAGARSHASNHGYDHNWNQQQFGARHYGDNNIKTMRVRFKSTFVSGDEDATTGEKEQLLYHKEAEFMLKFDLKLTDNTALSIVGLGGTSDYHVYGTEVFSVGYDRQSIETTYKSDGKRKSTLQVLFLTGEDYAQKCETGPYCQSAYERSVNGMRLGWGVNIFDSTRFYTSLYFENSDYRNQFFYQQRRDNRREFFMGMNTRFGDSWYLRPEIHYTENESNLSLYEHDRWLATLTFGWKL
ncbi:MAG: tetratricopeptide repeat protein [Gammaproteobacteria bacterium]|nr:tetratricopeptide repeat protein [Gammaproteobacteria bacterium]